MVFKPKKKRENLNIKLEINQCTIDQVKEYMFLGVILNGNLSWKPKIANIVMKVSNSINLICKSSLCLPTLTLPCTIVLFIPTFFITLRYGAPLIHPP